MIYDCAIIGLGVGGVFALHRISTKYKEMKVLGIEASRPPSKRRSQTMGFFGMFPNSDGKLYLSNLPKVAEIIGLQKTKSSHTAVKQILSQIETYKIIKDRSPNLAMQNKLDKIGYQCFLNDYIQIYPKEIHALSKYMVGIMEQNSNVKFSYDNEVLNIVKNKNIFTITTEYGEFKSKKLILSVGHAGWRWAQEIYAKLGIIENNDTARFGIRIETNAHIMKDFNRSNCTIKKTGLELGPLSWNGTVIPVDHFDMAISDFRSNEERWETDKVSFNLIGDRSFPNQGFEQTDRLAKLTFLIANDRISKERVSTIINGRSKISIMREYDWLKPVIQELATVLPEIITKSHFHVPTVIPMAPKINIKSNLESDISGMYVIGESAGVHGLLAAACMGVAVGDFVVKKG